MLDHDHHHCADYTDDCPKSCFRAQLMKDFSDIEDGGYTIWMHYKGTGECQRKDEMRNEQC